MMSFNLLDLPIVPRQKALKYLEPIDLFELSLCSKRMAQSVRDLKIEASAHFITLTRGQSSVHVQFKERSRAIWWDFKEIFMKKDLKDKRKIGYILFENCEKFRRGAFTLDEFYCHFDNLEEGAAAVSKHFQFLFPGPLNILLSPTVYRHLEFLFFEPSIQKCESFEMCGADIPAKRTMNRIFDKLTIEKKLCIRPKTSENYVIKQALRVEELFLRSARWMTREHLLELNCIVADLSDHNFQCSDFEAFAEKWMNNKSSKVENLRFQWQSDVEFKLENLKTSRWDSTRRERNYIFTMKNESVQIDCSDGFELERNDGRLATFVVEQQEDRTHILYFLVWIELFPEKKRLENLPKTLGPLYKQLEKINRDYPDESSLERLLSNPNLVYTEFLETYKVLKNMDGENRSPSTGQAFRRTIFDKIYNTIDL